MWQMGYTAIDGSKQQLARHKVLHSLFSNFARVHSAFWMRFSLFSDKVNQKLKFSGMKTNAKCISSHVSNPKISLAANMTTQSICHFSLPLMAGCNKLLFLENQQWQPLVKQMRPLSNPPDTFPLTSLLKHTKRASLCSR